VGVLTKFSHRGVFIKSYEGELNMGGIRNHTDHEGRSSMVANTCSLVVRMPELPDSLRICLCKEVVVKYHQSFPGLSRNAPVTMW
jgi:hypothetical protein